MKKNVSAVIVFIIFIVCGCKKEAGEGGNSTIYGSVWTKLYNTEFTAMLSEYAGSDEWVYIVYGDDKSYGNRIQTNYKGEYEFKYLRPGKYTIYVYSRDSTMQSPSGETAVIKKVEITKRKQSIEAPLITIFK
jgi:hypothetical protein